MVKLIRFIAIVSLFGLVLLGGVIIGVERVSKTDGKEGELELYFENVALLPRDMNLGEDYIVSFGLMSHKKIEQEYTYIVKAGSDVLENKTIMLSPRENRMINIIFSPVNSTWETKKSIRSLKSEFYLPLDKTWIGTKDKINKGYIIGNSVVGNYEEYVYSNLSKFDIEGFDFDVFTSIQPNERGNYSVIKTYSEGNTTKENITNILIQQYKITIEREMIDTRRILGKETFVVSVFGEDGRKYEINFWYSVK